MSDDSKTKNEDTVVKQQWDDNNINSIFKPSRHDFSADGAAIAGHDNSKPTRKSPPRFLGKRNRNPSLDHGSNARIKKTLSWADPVDVDKAIAPPPIDEDYSFPIKFSLSHEYKDDDASFSEYLKDANFSMGPSPRGSPMTFSDHNLFPSPSLLHGDTFDFADNNVGTPPPLQPTDSAPNTLEGDALLESPPDIKNNAYNRLPPPRFPMELMASGSSGSISPIKSGGPTQRLSPGRTIYNVASESVGSPQSPYYQHHQSTPLGSSHDSGSTTIESTPEFNPPRGNLRGQSRSGRRQTTITVTSTTNTGKTEARRHDGGEDHMHTTTTTPSSNTMLDPITPSPSQIRQAVSDESHSPAMAPTVHHPPPRAHYPHPAGHSRSGWSDLHKAPLPPFVQPPHGQWRGGRHLPPALPSSSGGSSGYHQHPPYYSPYYRHQAVPDRAPSSSNHTLAPPHLPPVVQENRAEETYWQKHHHLLHQFLLQFGHCNVPEGYGIGTYYEALYHWCADQRTEYQRMCRPGNISSTMTPSRVRTLTSMGFVWGAPLPTNNTFWGSSSSQSFANWEMWIEELKTYKSKHRDVDVPLKYSSNPSLGTFVNRQRTEYRKYQAGKPTSLTADRIAELNVLGFNWTIRDAHASWNKRYAELKEFRTINGHTSVPKVYNKNPSLGYWVNEQRFQYRRMQKKKSSYMTEEKVRLLNEIDFKVCYFVHLECVFCCKYGMFDNYSQLYLPHLLY